MGLTTCPDCKNEVSTNAVACPKCGSPIATKVTDKSFDEFVKQSKDEEQAPMNRSTIQLTSKSLKMQTLISCILFIGGLIVGYTNIGDPETMGYAATAILVGGGWYIITKIKMWWHHD